MIGLSPREWATRKEYPEWRGPYRVPLSPGAWVVRHGLWILLLLFVTVWEVLGFIFPVARQVPKWWDHPTLSQEIKAIIGTSLTGRVIATAVMIALSSLLTLHWAWRIPS